MAFPTTSVLTTLTGADEDPISEGGNWSGPTRSGIRQMARVSNRIERSAIGAAGSYGSWWNVQTFGPDTEVFCTLTGTFAAGETCQVIGRVHNPGDAALAEFYLAAYTGGTGFRCFKCLTGGSFTQIGSTNATAASVNDKLGLEVIGTSIKAYHFTGGSWVQRVSGTDTDITGTGYIGIEMNATDQSADDFGGGTVVVGALAVPAEFPPRHFGPF